MTNVENLLPDLKENGNSPVIIFNRNTEFSNISDFVNFMVERYEKHSEEGEALLDSADFTGFNYTKRVKEELQLSFRTAFEKNNGQHIEDLLKKESEGAIEDTDIVETSDNLDILYSYLCYDMHYIGFITPTGLVTMISFEYNLIVFPELFSLIHYHPESIWRGESAKDAMYYLTHRLVMIVKDRPDSGSVYRFIDLGLEANFISATKIYFSSIGLESAQKYILPLLLNGFGDMIDWTAVPEDEKSKWDTSQVKVYTNYFSNVPVNLFPSFLGRPDYIRNPGYIIGEFTISGDSQIRPTLINAGLAIISNDEKEKWLQVIKDYEIEHLEGVSLAVKDPRWGRFIEVLNGR